jgi:hypothetical protein
MGRPARDPDLPGNTELTYSDEAARSIYRHWLNLLTAE